MLEAIASLASKPLWFYTPFQIIFKRYAAFSNDYYFNLQILIWFSHFLLNLLLMTIIALLGT